MRAEILGKNLLQVPAQSQDVADVQQHLQAFLFLS